MLISYVVPTFNRAHKVARTIDSILQQPYPNIEILVINDGSTDNINDIYDKYKNEAKVTFIYHIKNMGQNYARNTGISVACGDIVTIMDSDDSDYGTDLSPIVNYFQNNPDVFCVFTPVVSMSTGNKLGFFTVAGEKFQAEGFLNGIYNGEHQAFLKKAFLKNPVFDEDLNIKRSCTLLTWLRLGMTMNFVVLDYPTRLYDDTGVDRMGNLENILKDAGELATCHKIVLSRFGEYIQLKNINYFNSLILKTAYYELLANGRLSAIKQLKNVAPRFSTLKIYLSVLISICLGQMAIKFVRKGLQIFKRS
jgi:glycosyltransferase involved in cell wall biosynthesis